jgi:hypothetical protein
VRCVRGSAGGTRYCRNHVVTAEPLVLRRTAASERSSLVFAPAFAYGTNALLAVKSALATASSAAVGRRLHSKPREVYTVSPATGTGSAGSPGARRPAPRAGAADREPRLEHPLRRETASGASRSRTQRATGRTTSSARAHTRSRGNSQSCRCSRSSSSGSRSRAVTTAHAVPLVRLCPHRRVRGLPATTDARVRPLRLLYQRQAPDRG